MLFSLLLFPCDGGIRFFPVLHRSVLWDSFYVDAVSPRGMQSNVFQVMILLVILIGIPAGVCAGESATGDLNTPILPDTLPFGIMTGENTLLPGMPAIGDLFPDALTAGATSPLVEELLRGNQAFRENVFSADPALYQSLAQGQSPGILWIGCSDSRSDPERITHSPPGALFVTRNIGNIVPTQDWSLVTVVEYAVNNLEVEEIVVVGHSDCGAMKALDADLQDPYITLWLNDAREAKERVDARISKPETSAEQKVRARQIELENIRLQTEHLMTYPTVRDAVSEERITVHGMYYDLATGTLSPVV